MTHLGCAVGRRQWTLTSIIGRDRTRSRKATARRAGRGTACSSLRPPNTRFAPCRQSRRFPMEPKFAPPISDARPESQRPIYPRSCPFPFSTTADEDTRPNDLQLMIMHRSLARTIDQHNFSKKRFRDLYQEQFKDIKTMKQLNNAAKTIIAQLELELTQEQTDKKEHK